MTKQVLLRMSDEQHEQAKQLAKESGLTLSGLFVERTLGSKTPSAYASLQRETQVLNSALVLAGLEGHITQARALLGGEDAAWQPPQSPAPARPRSKRSSR